MIWRAVKESNPAGRFWRPASSQRTTRIWRRVVSPSHMPRAARSAFHTAPGPRRVHSPNWRKAVGLDPHIREDATRFRNEGAPCALHLPKLAEAERVERSRPFRVIIGFKPTKHAACEPLNWRRADHSKAMPQSSTHRLATACRALPASLSLTGARLRTCTPHLPLTRRAHRSLCVTGKMVGRPGIAPGSHRLKGGSLSR